MYQVEGYIRQKVPHQEEKCEKKKNEENINTNKYPRTERRQPADVKDYITDENSIKYNVDYCYRMRDIPTTYK